MTTERAETYNTNFGLFRNTGTQQVIDPGARNLQTGRKSVFATASRTDSNEFPRGAKTNIYSFPGEPRMLISDMPSMVGDGIDMAPQSVIEIADNTATGRPRLLYGTMGVCVVSPTLEWMAKGSESPFSDGMDIHPGDSAGQIFPDARFDGNLQADIEAAEVIIIQQPRHGTIVRRDVSQIKYAPEDGFIGDDQVVFLVNIGGKNIKVIYFIEVVDISTKPGADYDKYQTIYRKHCGKGEWRILHHLPKEGSVASHFSGLTIYAEQRVPLLSFGDISHPVIGKTAGQSQGSVITLSRAATATATAGYGWVAVSPCAHS